MSARPLLILYPDPPPESDEALAKALRAEGAQVQELVIGRGYTEVLDALEADVVPVVIK